MNNQPPQGQSQNPQQQMNFQQQNLLQNQQFNPPLHQIQFLGNSQQSSAQSGLAAPQQNPQQGFQTNYQNGGQQQESQYGFQQETQQGFQQGGPQVSQQVGQYQQGIQQVGQLGSQLVGPKSFQQRNFQPINPIQQQLNTQQKQNMSFGTQNNIPQMSINPNMNQFMVPQNNTLQPNPFKLQTDEVKNLREEIKKLKEQLEAKEEKRQRKIQKIIMFKEQLKAEKKRNSLTNEQLAESLQLEINDKTEQIEQLEKKLKLLSTTKQSEINNLKIQVQNLKDEIENKQNDLIQRDNLIKGSVQGKSEQIVSQLQAENTQYQEKIKQLQNQIFKMKSESSNGSNAEDIQEIQQLREQNQEYQSNIQKLQQQVEKEGASFRDELAQTALLRKEIRQLEKTIIEKDQSIEGSKKLLKNANQQITELKEKNQELQSDLEFSQQRIKNQEELLDKTFKELQKSNNQGNPDIQKMIQKQKKEEEERNQQKLEKENKNKLLQEQQMKKNLEEQQQKQLQEKQILQQNAEEKKKLMLELKKRAKEAFGKMEVCFVVDITGSMESYKKQTSDCIQGSVEAIKKETGRNASWSTVAYQDIAEFKKLGNQYHQHEFTEDSKKIVDYLQKLGCSGGGDACEDIKGGFKQMVTKLKWNTKFRIAVLICDAPCHGKKYHDANCGDDYPEDDIEEVIDLMIQQEIMLIGIQFVGLTSKMIQEFQAIYKRKGKEELFLPFDLQKTKTEDIWKALIDLIKVASATSTGTNNNSSKTKEKQTEKPKTKDGAMEALCRNKNFKQFDQDPNIIVVNRFQVYRVELKAQSFEKNLKSISNIPPEDFYTVEEGYWICIRTKAPFAFGMMKSVYLMKKKNDPLKKINDPQQHLYVIKMPLEGFYTSLDMAKKECRSHLICKNLMTKFMRDLREKYDQKGKSHKHIPQIQYSDFLILKESNDKFWIAERFFDGDFVKYNNNWGFILGEETIMNQTAQAFTFYTYQISGFQYMICDVQGVGIYFTDPAICTQSGNYDDTDMGVDGQGMYMVNFENKKQLAREILSVMDIEID